MENVAQNIRSADSWSAQSAAQVDMKIDVLG
jgi:hypothetical protein